jgi:hypothetical protein
VAIEPQIDSDGYLRLTPDGLVIFSDTGADCCCDDESSGPSGSGEIPCDACPEGEMPPVLYLVGDPANTIGGRHVLHRAGVEWDGKMVKVVSPLTGFCGYVGDPDFFDISENEDSWSWQGRAIGGPPEAIWQGCNGFGVPNPYRLDIVFPSADLVHTTTWRGQKPFGGYQAGTYTTIYNSVPGDDGPDDPQTYELVPM